MPFDPTKPRSRDEVLLQAIVSGDSSSMGEPRDREEEFVKAIADKETLPDYSEASNGDVLQIGTDGPEWGAVPNELPAIAAGDAGKVLKVNSGESGTEWGSIPNELPAIAAGDAGKVLKVNSGETGTEWGTVQSSVHLYLHKIKIGGNTVYGYAIIYSDRSSAYTASTLDTFLNNFGANQRYYPISGGCFTDSDNNIRRGLYIQPIGGNISATYEKYNPTDGSVTIVSLNYPGVTDDVITIL